jgi:hypothetical protein
MRPPIRAASSRELAEKVLAESVFPDSVAMKPMQGLVG